MQQPRQLTTQHKAYGVKVCGAALGDKDFEAAFLEEKQAENVEGIKSSLDQTRPLTYFSLQCRAGFLLETHLSCLTRDLVRAIDDALRGTYTKALGFDILDPNGQCPGERDPTFLRDLAGLKTEAGGVRLPQQRAARGLSQHPQHHPSPDDR
jgi:hypothetical protein